MSVGRQFRTIDFVFTINSADAGLSDALESIFFHCSSSGSAGEELHIEVGEEESTLTTAESTRTIANNKLVPSVVSYVNIRAAQQRQNDFPVLHAGAVGVHGEAVLFPGRSGSGKSTLVSSLVQGGAPYVADELLAIRTPTQITGYPKAITLKEGSWTALGMERPDVADERFRSTVAYVRHEHFFDREPLLELAPRAIVFPTFDPGSPASERALSAGEATTILAGCAYLPLSSQGFLTLARLAASVHAWEVSYPGTSEVLDAIDRLTRRPRSASGQFIETGMAQKSTAVATETSWADFETEIVIANADNNAVVHLDEDGRNQWLALIQGGEMQPQLRVELEALGVLVPLVA